MTHLRNAILCLAVAILGAVSVSAQQAQASPAKAQSSQQDQSPAPKNDSLKHGQWARVTVEVSGGQEETPIENASVYFKYIEEHKLRKDKKLEMNVKTNREGIAHVPDAPLGRVLVQVVADGWKPYGRWYDITETKQTIKIHLEKPPHWY